MTNNEGNTARRGCSHLSVVISYWARYNASLLARPPNKVIPLLNMTLTDRLIYIGALSRSDNADILVKRGRGKHTARTLHSTATPRRAAPRPTVVLYHCITGYLP